MHVSLTADNQLALTFRYDPRVVAAVKTITGRVFDPARKRWTVPAAHVAEAMTALKPFGFTCDPEVKRLKERLEEHDAVIAEIRSGSVPYDGKLPLYEFQKTGAGFIAAVPGALIGSEPGLGKTLQVLAACEIMKTKKHLIICPKTLIYQWENECNRWRPDIEAIVIDGNKKDREKLYEKARKTESYFLITGYETARVDEDILSSL